jgi:hypothetical protein
MANALAIELRALSAAAVDAAGASLGVDIGTYRSAVELDLALISLSDGASLTPRIETSPDNAAWRLAQQLDSIAEPGLTKVLVDGLQRYVRVAWEITGVTPSIKFALAGEAHSLFCTPEQLTSLSISGFALANVDPKTLLEACIAGSTEAYNYLASSHTPPILAWDKTTTQKTGLLIASIALNPRGRDPNGPDEGVHKSANEARTQYFERIANGKLKPPGIVDSTPEVFEGGSVVASKPGRGW